MPPATPSASSVTGSHDGCCRLLLPEDQKRPVPRWEPALTCVELRGFEPLTPSMPWRCATSCATAPLTNHLLSVDRNSIPTASACSHQPVLIRRRANRGRRLGGWRRHGMRPCLPAAAGGLIGTTAAVQVHLHRLAEASFGVGVICWILLGSVIVYRLFTRPALPSALVPTMAIELGIPAVAGLAYFALAGQTVSVVASALGGYAVLMALVQVRMIPIYGRLPSRPDSGPLPSPTPQPPATCSCGSRSPSRPAPPALRSRLSPCSPPSSRGLPSAQ
jgi:Voltage-dependent anion channel